MWVPWKERVLSRESFREGSHWGRGDWAMRSAVGMQGSPACCWQVLAGPGGHTESVEGSRSQACRQTPAVSELLGALGWRQYLLEDYTGQMLPALLKPSPLHIHEAVSLDWSALCLGKAAFVFECSIWDKPPRFGWHLITGHILNFEC